jgi:hypothetical protein
MHNGAGRTPFPNGSGLYVYLANKLLPDSLITGPSKNQRRRAARYALILCTE